MSQAFRLRCSAALLVLLAVSATRADEPTAFQFDPREERFESPVDKTPQTYLVQEWGKPDAAGEGPLLVLYLHGSGSHQDQGMKAGIFNDTFGKMGRWMAKRHAVYICPEYRGNSWMGPAADNDLVELLRLAREKYKPSTILLTGASMGGTSVLIFASLHPDLIDGVLAWCPATDPVAMVPRFAEEFRTGYGGLPADVPAVYRERTSRDRADALAKLPLVIIHGEKDTLIPVEHARVLVERLREKKARLEYVEQVNGDHGTPLNEEPVKHIEWLLDQVRAARK